MRQVLSYESLGDTLSLCEVCLKLVPAKVIFDQGRVLYEKFCVEHGVQRALVSTNIPYYLWSKEVARRPTMLPESTEKEVSRGCPYDCGLCKDHEQHTCAAIIEILDDCNMRCPTCIAGSFPGAGNRKSIADIELMMDKVIEREGGEL